MYNISFFPIRLIIIQETESVIEGGQLSLCDRLFVKLPIFKL